MVTIQGAGPGTNVLYTCSPCRVRCNVETTFHYDADFSEQHSAEDGK